ncbi:MAG: hypothetical protein AAF217_06110 [Pseudomonadota bacterium]
MTELTYDQFVYYAGEWGRLNQTDIANMWPSKGGWEGYAQAGIYNYIIRQNSTYDILREQPVYANPRKNTDFLLNGQSETVTDVVVELKCQSYENWQNFTGNNGLKGDLTKLTRELAPAYQQSVLLGVGFYFTKQVKMPSGFSHQVLGDGEIGICWAVDLPPR